MKKNIVGVLLVLMCSVVLVSMLSSCDFSPRSKALVIVNDSTAAIDHVSIRQYISGSKMSDPNALAEGETIAAGSKKTFYIAPYTKDSVYLEIDDDALGSANKSFIYDYRVNGINTKIIATYDGTDITLSGSNARIPQNS